ncbi:MAG: carboxypeptidase regulatory-like domain-containing protein [Prolixibacteraceae bacterium]|jgi:hypothetical protein|nr:carboxypeptidase regulatory-like domain-containing protein [Prolixibacteraceae bacterium]
MKAIIPVLILILLSYIKPAAQTPVDSMFARLENYKHEHQHIKTLLLTDKDIYAPGEKIWYKISLHNILTESLADNQVLIVMLKTDQGEVVIDQKLVTGSDNNSQGSLTIPSWTPEGNAYLLAYTSEALSMNGSALSALKPIFINRLERNDFVIGAQLSKKLHKPGEKVNLSVNVKPVTNSSRKERISITLFDGNKEIFTDKQRVETEQNTVFTYQIPNEINRGLYFVVETIGRGSFSTKVRVPTTADKISMHFYPEGSNIISNLQQRIVYRAFDTYGLPVEVEGSIYDQTGHQTGLAKLLKNNMGLISLMPSAQNTYHLKIESAYGKGQQITLPRPQINTSAIHLVKSDEEHIRIDVLSNGSIIENELILMAVQRGTVVLDNSFIADSKNSFQLAAQSLPRGIISFLVYSPENGIISERLIYNGLSVPADNIDITVSNGTPLAISEFDLTVKIDTTNLPGEEYYVDIKVVDKQNIIDKAQKKDFDFLKFPLFDYPPQNVLTQYVTNIELIGNEFPYFSYQKIFNGIEKAKSSEKGIGGTVLNKEGEPVPNANVILKHPQYPSPYTVQTDSSGRFTFGGVSRSDEMVIKAVTDNGKKEHSIVFEPGFNEAIEDIYLKKLFQRSVLYHPDTYEYNEQNKGLLASIGTETKNKRPTQPSPAERMLKSGSSILEVIKMMKPFDIVNNQIVFFGSQNSLNFQQGALIVIDGQKAGTGIDVLSQLSPANVSSINISTSPIDIQRYTGLNSVGIIEINTFGAKSIDKTDKETENTASTFSYDNFTSETWPYQTTLLWMPNAIFGENGVLKTTVRTSKIESEFVIDVTLTTETGIRFKKQLSIKVGELN